MQLFFRLVDECLNIVRKKEKDRNQLMDEIDLDNNKYDDEDADTRS